MFQLPFSFRSIKLTLEASGFRSVVHPVTLFSSLVIGTPLFRKKSSIDFKLPEFCLGDLGTRCVAIGKFHGKHGRVNQDVRQKASEGALGFGQ